MTTVYDMYQGERLATVLLAPLVDDAPIPPGIDRLPGPGEAFVSPALAARIAATPPDQLGDRIGTVVGHDRGRCAPLARRARCGHRDDAERPLGARRGRDQGIRDPSAHARDPADRDPADRARDHRCARARWRCSSRRRRGCRRLAASSGSPRSDWSARHRVQVTRLAVVEALLASVLGVVVGIGLFFLSRPLVAMVPLDEATWFPDAIQPPLLPGDPAARCDPGRSARSPRSWRCGAWPSRRSASSVARRPPMPGMVRAVPLIVSVVVLIGAMAILRSSVSQSFVSIAIVGGAFGGVILGIVLIGPWLTFLVGRALHALPGGASTLLASRRLTDDPRGSFGSIAGVIMAVFVASAFFTFVGYAKGQTFDRAGILHAGQVYVEMPYNEGPPFAEVPARIAAMPGVTSVLPIVTAEMLETGPATVWVAPCADVARQFEFPAADCGPTPIHLVGGFYTLAPGDYQVIPDRGRRDPLTVTVADGDVAFVKIPNERVANRLPLFIIEPSAVEASGPPPSPTKFYVDTDGSAATAERVRTAVMADVPTAYVRLTGEDRESSRIYEEFGRVVGLGLIGSLILAGCSLAVAVTTGILERRRQFALLRSAGMPVARLRALVLLQAGAPLVTVAVFSAALGIGIAQAILRLADATEVALPDASLLLTLVVSLASAIALVVLMLPPLERLTRPETVRIE